MGNKEHLEWSGLLRKMLQKMLAVTIERRYDVSNHGDELSVRKEIYGEKYI